MTEYASSSADSEVVDNVNSYIKKEIFGSDSANLDTTKGKLGELYKMSDKTAATEGVGITLTVTFENTDSGKSLASNLAKQLGLSTENNIVEYPINK